MSNNTNALKNQLSNPNAGSGREVSVIQDRVTSIVNTQESEYINLWGGRDKANRFMQSFVSAILTNPALAQCEPSSIKKAGIDCAIAGLIPGNVLGEAWFIKYGNKCMFQIGYPGYRKMFYRSPLARGVRTWARYAEDYFEDNGNYHDYPEFVPAKGDRGSLIGIFCVAELSTGYRIYSYMTTGEVKAWMVKYSPGYNRKDSAWQTSFEAMAKKTVLLRVLGDCPMEDIQQQITREMSNPVLEEESGELMGEGKVKDPNEIIIDDIDIVRSSIKSYYEELNTLLPDDWTLDYIRDHNTQFLAVNDTKQCNDIDKLKELLADLEGQITKIEKEELPNG